MQACGQQKLSGSSFAGAYISDFPARFHSGRLAVIRPKSCVGEVLMHIGLHGWSNAVFGLTTPIVPRGTILYKIASLMSGRIFITIWDS